MDKETLKILAPVIMYAAVIFLLVAYLFLASYLPSIVIKIGGIIVLALIGLVVVLMSKYMHEIKEDKNR